MDIFRLQGIRCRGILSIEELAFPAEAVSCISGESGSGKTTLLRLLNLMITPDAGQIWYKGRELAAWHPVELRREVIQLPQTPVVFPGTIRENLTIGLRLADQPLPADQELRDILETVALAKPLDGDAAVLSGGEHQRMALARGLLFQPEVLLLDEPSAALDEGSEERVIAGVISSVKARGKTLIMVTHAKSIIREHSEFTVELAEGQIVSEVKASWTEK